MTRYVYPGSFSPPTIGHFKIVLKACEIFPKVTILCSRNTEKSNNWFDEKTCKKMWQSYKLPSNAEVKTFDELRNEISPQEKTVMIRGIRNENDYLDEGKVMKLNHEKFGIDTFVYFRSDAEYAHISSSIVRKLALDLDLLNLSKYVSPYIMTNLIEKVLNIKNIYLVVGKPGSGKSTFLDMLSDINSENGIIKTDKWSDEFKPLIAKEFGTDNLIQLVLRHEKEVSRFLSDKWFSNLKSELIKEKNKKNIFVEAAYGLSPNKSLFRFLGRKIIYIGCESESENIDRNVARDTPELIPFIEKIPGKEESEKIVRDEGLTLITINTSCTLEELKFKAEQLNAEIQRESKKKEVP